METERDHADSGLERRLKAALDRFTPPAALPRYQSVSAVRPRGWRPRPILVAAAAAAALIVLAAAATGSPIPALWTQRAASTLQSIGHLPPAVHSPAAGAARPPTRRTPAAAGAAASPSHDSEPRPTQEPEPSEAPGRSPSPEPSGGGSSGEDRSRPSPSPSPSPDDH
jgi:hypothetical protein